MATYLVEAYTPGRGAMDDAERRARRAADDVSHGGSPVRYLRAIFVPEDEICFHIFEAPSAEAVRQATDDAALDPQRIVEAIDLGDIAPGHEPGER
jgi:hypothetical protein